MTATCVDIDGRPLAVGQRVTVVFPESIFEIINVDRYRQRLVGRTFVITNIHQNSIFSRSGDTYWWLTADTVMTVDGQRYRTWPSLTVRGTPGGLKQLAERYKQERL